MVRTDDQHGFQNDAINLLETKTRAMLGDYWLQGISLKLYQQWVCPNMEDTRMVSDGHLNDRMIKLRIFWDRFQAAAARRAGEEAERLRLVGDLSWSDSFKGS